MKNIQKTENKIAVFEDKKIRRILHKGEWFFSVIDVIRVLTESADPNRYWPELKKKLLENEGFSQLLDKIEQLKLGSKDESNDEPSWRSLLVKTFCYQLDTVGCGSSMAIYTVAFPGTIPYSRSVF